MDKVKKDFEYQSRKYRERYMTAFVQLYKDVENEDNSNGRSGTGETLHMDDKIGHKILRDS